MKQAQGQWLIQGAGRGIGLALVRRLLAEQGVTRVYAGVRKPARSEALHTLVREHPDRLRLLELDVTREDQIAAAAAVVADESVRLHGLINVAGLLHDADHGVAPEKRLEAVDNAAMQRVFAVNAFGPMLMGKHFFTLLCHDEPAFFASISARVGSISDNRLGGWYSYRASKAAQNQFTRTLAVEAARRAPHLRVLALHPGTVDTELSQPFQSGVPAQGLFDADAAAGRLLVLVAGCEPEDSGSFIAWDGQSIPW